MLAKPKEPRIPLPKSRWLAGPREVGGAPRYRAGPLRHRVRSRVGRRQHQCPGP